MTREEMMACIVAELERQGQTDDGVCLYNRGSDETGIDGYLRIDQLADAVLAAMQGAATDRANIAEYGNAER